MTAPLDAMSDDEAAAPVATRAAASAAAPAMPAAPRPTAAAPAVAFELTVPAYIPSLIEMAVVDLKAWELVLAKLLRLPVCTLVVDGQKVEALAAHAFAAQNTMQAHLADPTLPRRKLITLENTGVRVPRWQPINGLKTSDQLIHTIYREVLTLGGVHLVRIEVAGRQFDVLPDCVVEAQAALALHARGGGAGAAALEGPLEARGLVFALPTYLTTRLAPRDAITIVAAITGCRYLRYGAFRVLQSPTDQGSLARTLGYLDRAAPGDD